MSARLVRYNGHYPDWICQKCGEKHSPKPLANHTSTWHFGTCGWCNAYTPVTQPRDYRYPRHGGKPNGDD